MFPPQTGFKFQNMKHQRRSCSFSPRLRCPRQRQNKSRSSDQNCSSNSMTSLFKFPKPSLWTAFRFAMDNSGTNSASSFLGHQEVRAHHCGAFVGGTIGAFDVDAIERTFRARDSHFLDNCVEFNTRVFLFGSFYFSACLSVIWHNFVSHHTMQTPNPPYISSWFSEGQRYVPEFRRTSVF